MISKCEKFSGYDGENDEYIDNTDNLNKHINMY